MDTGSRYGEGRRDDRSSEELYRRFYNKRSQDSHSYGENRQGYAIPNNRTRYEHDDSDIYEQEISHNSPRDQRYEGRYGWYEEQDNDLNGYGNSMNDNYRRAASDAYNNNANPNYNYGKSGRGSYNNNNDMHFSGSRDRDFYEGDGNFFRRAGERIRDTWNQWSDQRNDHDRERYPDRNSRDRSNYDRTSSDYAYNKTTYRPGRYDEGEPY